MRDFGATKDTHQREEDEAARLVREAPKVKPPRDDRRRENIRPDRDPDTDGDPDTKGDPDMSLNRKNVGGSVVARLVLRAEEWVRVRNKEKDEVTRVKPDTLKDNPSLYEKVPENEPHRNDGIRTPRKPPRVHKPHYHKEHLPHPSWPEPRPMPDAPPRPPKAPKPPKAPAVPEPPEAEKEPKAKPPGWVPKPRAMTASLVERWQRRAGDDLVTVRRKEDGKVVRIKPETFKEAPSSYEQVEEEEESGDPSEKPSPDKASPAKPEGKDPQALFERGEAIRRLIKDNPAVESKFKGLKDPTSPLRTIADKVPAAALLGGTQIPGLDTVADILEAMNAPRPAKPTPAPDIPVDIDQEAQKQKPPQVPAPPPSEGKAPDKAPEKEEKAPEKEAPKKGPSEKSPKDKGKDKGKAPDKAPDHPVVRRPTTTPEDQARAQRLLVERLGPNRAKMLLRSGMHPHDVETMVAAYDVAKSRDVTAGRMDEYVEKAREFFQLDPSKVSPPAQARNAKGDMVPYETLSPEEQGEAWQQHRNKVVAMSLAVRRQVFDGYRRAGAPKAMARAMMNAKLSGGDATEAAQQLFEKTLSDGAQEKLPPAKMRALLESTTDPNVRQVAAAYVQARSYQAARRAYLDPSSPKAINEAQSPGQIAERLTEVTGFLREKDQEIPEGVPRMNLARLFRTRIFNRLSSLAPKKANKLLPYLDTLDAEEYRKEKKTWGKDHAAWRKETRHRTKMRQRLQAEAEKEQKAWEKDAEGYREDPPLTWEQRVREAGLEESADPPEPPKPLPPPRYHWRPKSEKQAEQQSRDLFDELVASLGGATPKTKVATVLVGRAFSSFAGEGAMTDRTAVYWGVAPYENQEGPHFQYPDWHQAHARDLGEPDYRVLLASAEEWLKSPVLASPIQGMVPDARFRAALDLAIREVEGGKYAGGLHPSIYNELLARLAGVSQQGTLLTIREASESTYSPSAQENNMKPSARIRQYAARFASANPAVAYDLLDMADKVAEDEQAQEQGKQAQEQAQQQEQGKQAQQQGQGQGQDQGKQAQEQQGQEQQKQAAAFAQLRSEVVRVAHQNPQLRPLFGAALQIIQAAR